MQAERRLPVARPAIFHPMQLFQEENHHHGRIEVICGSMFSGKTEELIRRLRRAKIAKQKVEIYKPAMTRVTATRMWYLTMPMPSTPPQ